MNMEAPDASGRRPYHSPARAAQKAATRRRILDALAVHMAAGTFDSVSMDAIAQAAGVSPATLYRYFPSREALFDAIADDTFYRRLGDLPYPRTPDEIAQVMQRSFKSFDTDPDFVRSYFLTNLGRTARVRGRKRRVEAIQAALRPATAGLDEEQRVAAEAIIAYLASIQAWITIQEEFGLTGAQVGQAVSWAIATLLSDLRLQQEQHCTHGPEVKGANDDGNS
jgi:AcrR family transcriptional regulator